MSDDKLIQPARSQEQAIKTTVGGDAGRAVARVDRAPPTWVVLVDEQVVATSDEEAQALSRAKALGGTVRKTESWPLGAIALWTLLSLTGVFTVIGAPLLAWTLYKASAENTRIKNAAIALKDATPQLSARAKELVAYAQRLHDSLPTAGIPDLARSDLEDSLEDIQADLGELSAAEGKVAAALERTASAGLQARLDSVNRAYDSLADALASIDEALAGTEVELATDLGAVSVKAQAARRAVRSLE
jgi:hypothetical protein